MKFLITNNHLLRLILPDHAEGKMKLRMRLEKKKKNEVEIENEVEDEVKMVISREVRGWREEVETEVEVKE